MKRVFFKHLATGKEFDVVKVNAEEGTITLKGTTTGAEIVEPFDKEKFKHMGYELLSEDVPEPVPAT